ncbi:MAG: metallophosphoesterase [Rhodobacterales bacterium]|nr:metallophosphoesterase [Rhodobacterales bacterium]
MRLVHLADIHFGAADPHVLDAAAVCIEQIAPHALIVAGDLTQSGKRREFEAARAWLEALNLPCACTPGNHDTPMFQLHHRVLSPFARYRKYLAEFGFPLQAGAVRVDGLNTARGWQARRNWAEGSVDLDDLEAVLAAGKGAGIRLLSCHHPFVAPTGAPLQTETRRGRRASQRLARSPVQVLLSGHVHAPQAELITAPEGSYVSVTSGTLSMRLRNVPPSFNVLAFDGDVMRITAYVHYEAGFTQQALGEWNLSRMERLSSPGVVSP